MKKVIDGDDPGGVTEAMGWKGGGGYRYYRLAPSLLEKDAFGQWVISPAYNAEMLAEAMCVHFGFTYAPSPEHYWMQGRSSETDFIYVTTNSLTHEQLKAHFVRGWAGPHAPDLLQGVSRRKGGRFHQPHHTQDTRRSARPLRMGQGRLLAQDRKPPDGRGTAGT